MRTLRLCVPDRADRTAVLDRSADTPLVAFKIASACSIQRPELQNLLDRDPRFVEANYFLGVNALSAQLLRGADEAVQRFQAAYNWRQDWPALTLAIANLAVTAEDFDRAVDFATRHWH